MGDKTALAQEIKSRVILSTVVRPVVQLKGRGSSLIGLCPFHNEKTPSFHVRDHVARFKCFGCGASGDVIEFVMRVRGIGFNEAVVDLAEKAGILAAPISNVEKSRKDHDLLSVQKIAQEYFRAQLEDARVGQAAMHYLSNVRGLSPKMIEQAGLGFGGLSSPHFLAYLKQRRVSEQLAQQAGLVKQRQYSNSAQFLSRITFPIRNNDGQIIAFGGREFLETAIDGPKYVNTHSYEHYEKRRHFYGLYESKNALLKGVPPILVEGYFDAMAMWAMGVPALALCGTALSSEHVSVLKALTSRIYICFDRDNAGLLALKRALVELLRKNISPSLILLDKKDAGDYLRDRNLAELKTKITQPIDALCFLIESAALVAKTNINDRVNQIDELLPIFASIKRPIVRRQYVAHLAKYLHEDPTLLWVEIEKRSTKNKSTRVQDTRSEPLLMFSPSERLIIEIMLAVPSLHSEMGEVLKGCSAGFGRLLTSLLSYLKETSMAIDEFKQIIERDHRAFWPSMQEILKNPIQLSPEQAAHSLGALKGKIERYSRKVALKKKRQEMHEFERKGDFSSVLKNLKEQSVIVMSQKTVPDQKHFNDSKRLEKDPMKSPESIKKKKDIDGLESHSFFDAGEDWV